MSTDQISSPIPESFLITSTNIKGCNKAYIHYIPKDGAYIVGDTLVGACVFNLSEAEEILSLLNPDWKMEKVDLSKTKRAIAL